MSVERNTGILLDNDIGVSGYIGVVESTEKAVEPLPPACRVPGGRERGPVWVINFMDNAISEDFQ